MDLSTTYSLLNPVELYSDYIAQNAVVKEINRHLHSTILLNLNMLKLTMSPRKRSKRHRAIPLKLQLPISLNSTSDADYGEQQRGMLADNLRSLIRQEDSGKYSCSDYLNITPWQDNMYQLMKKPKVENEVYALSSMDTKSTFHHTPTTTATSIGTVQASARIDEYCREQIVEWSFRVVDYFRIDREVVSVSLSYLDRFLATCTCDRTSFKLAATTTLHLAVKLLYPCKLADLGILSDLSRGEFDMQDVCRMEGTILHSLEWNLHPPTPIAISSIFLDYFFATRVVSFTCNDLDDIYDVSSFFCELSVCDYYFVLMRPSTIALAAILNALEGMFGPHNTVSIGIIQAAHKFGLGTSEDLASTRSRLWELYERSEECALHNDTTNEEEHQSPTWHSGIFVKKQSTLSSPVSVSKPCHSATDFTYSTQDVKVRNESW